MGGGFIQGKCIGICLIPAQNNEVFLVSTHNTFSVEALVMSTYNVHFWSRHFYSVPTCFLVEVLQMSTHNVHF